jgi:hypothetical protein
MTHAFNSWALKCMNELEPISLVSGAGMNEIHWKKDG